jgi:hypothetical protein
VGGKMAKLDKDQYFTSPEVAEHCFKKTLEVIGEENITEFIESSSGEGIFIDMIEKFTPNIPYQAYDIDVKDSRVIEQDFLKLELEYKKGRCVGFNFPFGVKNNLSKSFANKGFEIGEYVCSILPISQLKNTQSIYKFDLIYSEDLKSQIYSNIKIHCCFNIYKKPIGGFNKKENYKNDKIIEIREVIKNKNPKRNKELGNFKWDLRLLAWGVATNNRGVGSILNEDDKLYAKEFYVKINDEKNKEEIINIFKTTKWEEIYPQTATPNLLQWQVYKHLKEQIPELE